VRGACVPQALLGVGSPCDRPSAHAQEGLRLYPPAVFAAVREATENVEVCGHVIPRGAWIHVRGPAVPG
jgi:cytochrome P450